MMARPYKAPNKRIIHRTRGGRFRRSTLSDVGLGCCERCGGIFTPDVESARDDSGFIDPFEFNRARKICPDCRTKKE